MIKKTITFLLALFPLFLISCAKKEPIEPFAAHDLTPFVESGKYSQKVDNFLVLIDASASMLQTPDSIYYYTNEIQFDQARMVADYLNQTIPALTLQGEACQDTNKGLWLLPSCDRQYYP